MAVNSASSAFIPMSMLLQDIGVWPSDMMDIEGGTNILDRVGIQDVNIIKTDTQITAYFTVVFDEEIIFRIPGVSALGLVIGGNGEVSSFVIEVDLRNPFQVRLVNIFIKLRLSPDILKPVIKVGDSFQIDPEKPYLEIGVQGSLSFDSKGLHVEGMNELSLSPCMIGESGVVIEASSIALALSDNSSMPQVQVAGLSANWKGIFIESAAVHLPSEIPAAVPDQLQMHNCFIGTGGFTGKLNVNWDATSSTTESNSQLFTVREVKIEFFQSSLLSAELHGILQLPFFDAPLDAGLYLSANGLIAIEASNPAGTIKLKKEGVEILELNIQTVKAQIEKGLFSLTLSGGLTPKLGGFTWPSFDLKALTIDSKGHVKIDGGWIAIPQGKTFNFNGFNIEISKIGFGKDKEGYNWVGFSGGVQIVEDLPLKGGVEGLKILWNNQGEHRFQISGIAVAGEIKNVLSFDGKAVFINEGSDKGFKGGMSVIVEPLDGMTFNAQFIAGRSTVSPQFNYFYLFIDVGLPVGIPLACTGLSLYGFAGLFGYNMRPLKILRSTDGKEEEWVENYDETPTTHATPGYFLRDPVGITSMTKWEKSHHHLAFGAGLTLGTGPDNGFNFAAKALLVVVIPGPTILLEGKATLVEKRSNLEKDPPLRMLAVFDKRSGTILMNIRAEYAYPRDSGEVISITASGEVYFNFNNPSAWHIYLGQETPEAKRIRAKILKLFDASSFFMLDSSSFVTGGGIAFGKKWTFSVLTVKLKARIEGRMGISWKPPQAEGSLLLDGDVKLSACGHGIGLSIGTDLDVKTPTPWHVRGQFKVKLNLPWPLPDPKAKVTLEWKNEKAPPYPLPLISLGMEHLKVNETWPLEKLSNYTTENPPGEFADRLSHREQADPTEEQWKALPTVPLDAKLALHFARPIEDTARIGKNADVKIYVDSSGPYKFKYRLKQIIIEKKLKSNPTEAWTVYAQKGDGTASGAELSGTWQAASENGNIKNLKLLLGVDTPFGISRQLKDNEAWLGSFTYQWPNYPCAQETEPTVVCVDYLDLAKNTKYYSPLFHHGLVYFAGTPIQIIENEALTNALTLAAPKSENSISFADFTLPQRQGKFNWKDVVFRPGIDAEGLEISFRIQEGSPPANIPGLFVSFSPKREGPSAPMSIEFPSPTFIQGPDLVVFHCIHQKDLQLYAYDSRGTLVGSAKHLGAASSPIMISIEGKDIRKIEILGVNILIFKISYQSKISVSPWQDLAKSIRIPIFEDLARSAQEEKGLLVMFPQEMDCIELYLSTNSKGKAITYDKTGKKMSVSAFDLSATRPQNSVKLKKGESPIRAVALTGDFAILKLCMLTMEESARIAQQLDHFQYVREKLSLEWKSQNVPLLDPQCYYRLTVVTETQRGKGENWEEPQMFKEYAFFQTANPPGMYDPLPPASSELENKLPYPHGGMLKDLSPYVMETIPPMGAPNEEQRPFYRTYDIGVKFNEPLGVVNAMYEKTDAPLMIQLCDNNNQPVLDDAGREIVMTNHWDKNRELLLTREELQWKEFLDTSGCIRVSGNYTYPQPSELYVSSKDLVLKPQTFYKAKLTANSPRFIPAPFPEIARLENISYTVYEFSFVTSRYAHLTDHLHSFIGKPWNHHRILGSPEASLLTSENLSLLRTIVISAQSRHTPETYQPEVEDQNFGTLLSLFQLGIRKSPECLEVLLLNDSTGVYGLLLESPEPLEWERIEFILKFSETETEVTSSTGPVKFVQTNRRSASSDYNEEWIALLFTDSVDLSGWKIQKKTETESDFMDYYLFPAQQKFSTGTLLKIHSGAAPSSPVKDGNEHVYRLAQGQPGTWQFDAAGVQFRLLDSRGKIVHEYISFPFENSPKTVVIRNLDQSKMFIFLTDDEGRHQTLPPSRYGLEFTYKRDIGSKGPLLKRRRSEQDESARIEFNLAQSLP